MQSKTVELETPIERGEVKITEISLRKPTAGDLRGLSMQDVANTDATALTTLLPRISQPSLTEVELHMMPGSDFMLLAMEVTSFLTPSRFRKESKE